MSKNIYGLENTALASFNNVMGKWLKCLSENENPAAKHFAVAFSFF